MDRRGEFEEQVSTPTQLVVEMRARLSSLEEAAVEKPTDDIPRSRRELLKLGGVAALGAVGAVALRTTPASAANSFTSGTQVFQGPLVAQSLTLLPGGPYVQAPGLPAGGASFAAGRFEIQSAERALLPIFSLAPATAGNEPFQVQMQSFANTGAGAGTYNHAMEIGWNAGRHTGGQGVVTGKAAMFIGLEDNYFDPNDSSWGTEFYVEYWSPDGTTVAAFRPFYARVIGSHTNAATGAIVSSGIGDVGKGGQFGVNSNVGGTIYFYIQPTVAVFNVPLNANGLGVSLIVNPLTGDARINIQSTAATNGNAALELGVNGVTTFELIADRYAEMYMYDNTNSRVMVLFQQGASNTAALVTMDSSLKVMGNLGFYGTTPVVKPTVTGAKGSNAALASLLTALAAQGLLTDSSTA